MSVASTLVAAGKGKNNAGCECFFGGGEVRMMVIHVTCAWFPALSSEREWRNWQGGYWNAPKCSSEAKSLDCPDALVLYNAVTKVQISKFFKAWWLQQNVCLKPAEYFQRADNNFFGGSLIITPLGDKAK